MDTAQADTGLLNQLYSAVDDPSGWPRFLEAFCAAIHVRRAHFWISRFAPSRPLLTAHSGLTDALYALIHSPGFRDPWFTRVDLATVPVGRILRSNEICRDEILVEDPMYHRVQQLNGGHYGGGVMLFRSSELTSGLTVMRMREEGPLTDAEIATWNGLIPHLQAAVRITGRLARLSAERDALMRYCDRLGHGLMLTSPSGWLCAANARAHAIIAHGDTLRLGNGHIEAVSANLRARLAEAIFQTGGARTSGPVRVLLQRSGEPRLMATVLPVLESNETHVAADTPTAAIYLSSPETASNFDPAPLRQLFGYTEAEARLACLLASGATLAEAAARLSVSVNTVRTHLQRALNKAGVNRQAELVAIVLKAAPMLADHPNG